LPPKKYPIDASRHGTEQCGRRYCPIRATDDGGSGRGPEHHNKDEWERGRPILYPGKASPEHQDQGHKAAKIDDYKKDIASNLHRGTKWLGREGNDVEPFQAGILRWRQSTGLAPAMKANRSNTREE